MVGRFTSKFRISSFGDSFRISKCLMEKQFAQTAIHAQNHRQFHMIFRGIAYKELHSLFIGQEILELWISVYLRIHLFDACVLVLQMDPCH